MKIYDNVLDQDYFKLVQKYYLSKDVAWHFNQNTSYGNPNEQSSEDDIFQFTCPVVRHGVVKATDPRHVEVLHAIVNKVFKDTKTNVEVLRAKFNLLPKQPYSKKSLSDIIHVDTQDTDKLSVLFYMNNSDGDTVFFDGDKEHKYMPKENTAVVFKSNIKHRATPPKQTQKRVVLNIIIKDQN